MNFFHIKHDVKIQLIQHLNAIFITNAANRSNFS